MLSKILYLYDILSCDYLCFPASTFYKLELVNREKNFNKMFGQKEMNVGVMQVGGAKKKKKTRSGERRGGSAPKPPKNGGGRFPDVGRS